MSKLNDLGLKAHDFLRELRKINQNVNLEIHVDSDTLQDMKSESFYLKNKYIIIEDEYRDTITIAGIPVKEIKNGSVIRGGG